MSTFRTIRTDATEGIEFAKNYIQNATFETNAISNWSEFSTSMSGGLPTGTPTISPVTNFSLSTNTSFPISGNTSLQVNLTGVLSAGIGFISDEFRIEEADYAKPLTFSFLYKTYVGATNANWSGILGSQTFGIYLYDVTNSQWVQPSGFLGMNQTTGVGQVMGSFQTNFTTDFINGQKYRFAVLLLQPTLGTIEINFDNFFLGKETSTVGTPVTDYIDYTPTTSWTTGYTISGKFKRIGDSIECIVKLVCTGAPLAASETTFSIPPGYAIDTTKLMSPTVAGTAPTFGDGIGYDNSTTNLYLFRCQYWSATTVKLFYQSSSTGQETAVSTSLPPTWATNDTIIARFQVPIVGLSSSVVMSNATDTRVVAANYKKTANQSVTANSTDITFQTNVIDTHGAYNGTAYIAPVSGLYDIGGVIGVTSGTVNVVAYVNGSSRTILGTNISANNATLSGLVSLNAGESLTFRLDQSVTVYGTSSGLTSGFTIKRLSGPSVVAASETVACRYRSNSGQSITNNTTTQTMIAGTRDYDTHLFYNSTTGIATIPVSGKYSIRANFRFTAFNASANILGRVYKNGSLVSTSAIIAISGTSNSWAGFANDIINCVAGDTLEIRILQDSGASRTLTTALDENVITIIRQGN